MTLTFSSLEEAWGGKSIVNPTNSKDRLPGNLLSNVSKNTESSVHSKTFKTPPPQLPMSETNRISSDKYENIYCNTIINHVQGCPYCQERLREIFKLPVPKPIHQVDKLSPSVLKRNNDNLAYVPFGLEPEVFNILLFSMILISLIFLIDKKGLKSFKF